MHCWLKFSCVFVAVGCGMAAMASAQDPVIDFGRDIRPILAEHCFACHGFDAETREADLRLDTAAAVAENVEGVWPFAPGDLDRSAAWERITSDDPDYCMPPASAHLPLTAESKEKIRLWILQGAPYTQHWSFAAPQQQPLPQPPNSKSTPISHPIDAWIQSTWHREQLVGSPPADRSTIVRRLSLDLVGLPASSDLVDRFIADDRPDAYERLVDELLASPHFGEHQATNWLDAARYADTNGYSIDGGRHAWIWRDWVIQAFNDNLPYDQFLVQQLAGDLIPEATDAQRIATGFQRNNMVTHEGGTIPEENLANYSADRMKTLGEAVMGLTLGCAQCHDHKYDPISQREYYQLAAFFQALPERGLDGDGGNNAHPAIQAKTVLKANDLSSVESELLDLNRWFDTVDEPMLLAWRDRFVKSHSERGQGLHWYPLAIHNVSTPNQGSGFGANARGWAEIRDAGGISAYDLAAALPETAQPIAGLRVIFHPRENAPDSWGHGRIPGGPDKNTFVLTSLDVSADAAAGDQLNLHHLESFETITASSWLPQFPPHDIRDHRSINGWSPDTSTNEPQHITVTFKHPLDPQEQRYVTVQVNFGYGHRLIAGLIEIQAFSGTDDGREFTSEIESLLLQSPESWDANLKQQLWSYYCSDHDNVLPQRIRRENLLERQRVLTEPFSTLVMQDAEQPRPTHILKRGDYAQPGEQVFPGTPAILPPLTEKSKYNRHDLAQWLVRPDHPLTARVAVNRAWQSLFGRGLVSTPADFGSQGAWPSHPELLDWLAVDFQDSGWDWKRLIKQIVMSQTYRQNSEITPEAYERDPENIWLARGPRFRLSAEQIRDQALAISGLLVPRLGGPSVNPYAPGDLWREVSHFGSTPATAQTFVQDHGEKLYRRSLYTYWKRTAPPVNMAVFDAPNREVCVVQRMPTTTPLQSLVLLNDIQFVEAARVFAVNLLHLDGSDETRLQAAIQLALSRPPSSDELSLLQRSLTRQRAYFTEHPEAAAALLANGEWNVDTSIPASEQAAWSQVTLMIFNLSEMVTRQ